ncbi:hypothetical protein M422DRAFT_60301 [Sphaerobolus stellatus SS14]|uniref:DDE Tnp4 domain-containing protein n=1 Tax=Sphaerobolus stellatus (strain SS14) TaxID=990650 RepID=A0A0C9VNW2_SPHS4|nr:hypothetical protein M422DRAFT_60301 [Sphaerobolus stellatus SS14]
MEMAMEEEEEEEVLWQERLLYIAGLLLSGAEMEREAQVERRHNHRLYLKHPELLRNPRAFITTMGFDVATFLVILGNFAEEWDATPIPCNDTSSVGEARIGRHSLDAAGALGLVLHYLNSTMCEVSLQQIFALIPITISHYLNFSLQILMLTVATTDNPEWENATYNGWLHSHCCNNVLVFSPRGEIIAVRINAPGSWHDSCVAKSIYQNLCDCISDGYYLVADTAFPCGTKQIDRKIKASLKSGQQLPLDTQELNQLLHLNRQLLSYRSFGHLRLPLDANNNQAHEQLLKVCLWLFQLRTRLVGINQIKNVYEPIWKEAEGADMWEGFENMMYGTVINRDRVSRFHIVVAEQE